MPVETIQRHGLAQGAGHGLGGGLKVRIKMATQPMSQPTPIAFIVDDDVSVRESLESLIGAENLRVETFACDAYDLKRMLKLTNSADLACLVSWLPGFLMQYPAKHMESVFNRFRKA